MPTSPLTVEGVFQDVATAIKNQTKKTAKIYPADMADEISGIITGYKPDVVGGGASYKPNSYFGEPTEKICISSISKKITALTDDVWLWPFLFVGSSYSSVNDGVSDLLNYARAGSDAVISIGIHNIGLKNPENILVDATTLYKDPDKSTSLTIPGIGKVKGMTVDATQITTPYQSGSFNNTDYTYDPTAYKYVFTFSEDNPATNASTGYLKSIELLMYRYSTKVQYRDIMHWACTEFKIELSNYGHFAVDLTGNPRTRYFSFSNAAMTLKADRLPYLN